eukprot:6179910-Pleurochrysis_carterae.AAC.1
MRQDVRLPPCCVVKSPSVQTHRALRDAACSAGRPRAHHLALGYKRTECNSASHTRALPGCRAHSQSALSHALPPTAGGLRERFRTILWLLRASLAWKPGGR